ncbi:hypothetical protein D3C71_1921630 [compost metagenome]
MFLRQQVGEVGIDLERRDLQGEEQGQRADQRQDPARVTEQPEFGQVEKMGDAVHGHGQSLTEPGRPGPGGYRG